MERLGDLCVLCAHRSGPLGVAGVNAQVEAWLSEGESPVIPKRADRLGWYAGQPLLVTENDHAAGLMNGEVGVVAREPEPGGALRAYFSDGRGGLRKLPLARLPQHVTHFAMTIHKSQGSQYRHAIVVLPQQPSPIVTRELLYTGLTRASAQATVIGPVEVIRAAVATRVQRASGLGEKLWFPP
jgi:exodeoxyribonuclease V alpha subunit